MNTAVLAIGLILIGMAAWACIARLAEWVKWQLAEEVQLIAVADVGFSDDPEAVQAIEEINSECIVMRIPRSVTVGSPVDGVLIYKIEPRP